MKYFMNYNKFQVMKRITFLLIASILFLTSCNNSIDDLNQGGRTYPNAEDVRITLNMPGVTVQTYSSATESECHIDNLWVLEFNSSGSLVVYDTLLSGSNILNNGKSTQLLPQLSFTKTDGNKIVLIANSGVTSLPAGFAYTNINTENPFKTFNAKAYYKGGDDIPMYGEMTWPASYSCEMIRAVAKIQVGFGNGVPDLPGYIVNNPNDLKYKVYNYTPEGFVKPEISIEQAATLSQNSTTEDFYMLQNSSASANELSAYVYETPNSIKGVDGTTANNNKQFLAKRQFLLLNIREGVTDRYWRIDFYDRIAKEFLDIRRNHHYIFTINKISSNGYTTMKEAFDNPGSNIEYEVAVRDGASHITSNGQYAVVTSVDTAYVTVSEINTTIARARFQLPIEMTTLVTGTTNSVSASGTGLTLNTPFLLTSTDVDVKVSTASGFTGGKIIFQLGNITHELVVKTK
jgi:hypothetical protein